MARHAAAGTVAGTTAPVDATGAKRSRSRRRGAHAAPRDPSVPVDAAPPTALRAGHEPGAPVDRSWLWWLIAAIAVGVCIWLHIEFSRSAVAPRTPWDEIHPLQMARMISGDDTVAPLSGSGYYPGWGIILAPLWWFTDDPATVYRMAVALGNILGVATIIPLAMIGRHLRLTVPQAITAAGIVMCLPGRIGPADYAMSEQALMFFYAWAVLAMFALWKQPAWWRLALLIAPVAAAYLTHTRALALLLTAVVWLAFFFRRHVAQAIVGVVLLVVSWWGIDRLATAINDRLLSGGKNKSDLAQSALLNAEPGLFVRVLGAQSWVQVVGSAGLFAVGAVIVVVWMLRELRTLRLGPGAFLFGLTVATVGMSVVWWTRPDILWDPDHPRLDAWLYSRYIDQVATFLSMVTISVLIRRVNASVIWTALGTFVLGAIPVVFWVAPHVPLWGVLSTSSSAVNSWQELLPADPFIRPLIPTFTNAGSFWLWGSLFAIVCLAALLALRRVPRVTVVVLLVLASVLSYTSDLDQSRTPPREIGATLERADAASPGDEPLPVDFDTSCGSGPAKPQMLNWSGFWFSPREVHRVDLADGEAFTSDLVISCVNNSSLPERGGILVEGESDYGHRVYVLPGPLQDELARAGVLEER